MRTYALAPSMIRGLLRRTLLRFHFIVTLSFLAFGVFLVMQPRPLRWTPIILIVAIIALAYFFIIFDHYRRQLRSLYSVRVEIMPSVITVRQVYLPEQHLIRAEVNRVMERKEAVLVYRHDRTWIEIPLGLTGQGDEDVREMLSLWTGEMLLPYRARSTNRTVFWFSVLAGVMILIYANSLFVAVPLGVFLFFFGMYVERRLWVQYELGVQFTRTYSQAFTFLIFVIVMKSCLLAAYTLYK